MAQGKDVERQAPPVGHGQAAERGHGGAADAVGERVEGARGRQVLHDVFGQKASWRGIQARGLSAVPTAASAVARDARVGEELGTPFEGRRGGRRDHHPMRVEQAPPQTARPARDLVGRGSLVDQRQERSELRLGVHARLGNLACQRARIGQKGELLGVLCRVHHPAVCDRPAIVSRDVIQRGAEPPYPVDAALRRRGWGLCAGGTAKDE
jgi:hypothetical protein